MKTTRKDKHLRYVALHLAVVAAVSSLAVSAQENGSYSVSTKKVGVTDDAQRIKKVASFADQVVLVMSSESSKSYLQNKNFADSSTFPMILTSRIAQKPWRNSPFYPIPPQDLHCYYGVPSYNVPMQFNVNTTPVTVEADTVSGELSDGNQETLTYSGNVEIAQGDRVLVSDKAKYNGTSKSFTTYGEATYKGPEYTVNTADESHTDLDKKQTRLKNTSFFLNGSYVRGTAKKHFIDSSRNLQVFKHATITSCPLGNEAWKLSATTLELDRNKSFGEAWNSVLWAGGVPVFYFPYVNFPITNKRQSGLLIPKFSVSSGRLSFSQPIYFNLAPNYDWTFTPQWADKHHLQLDNEFRFMPFANYYGEIRTTYLPDDPSWSPQNGDSKRWAFNTKQHLWFLNRDLNFFLNYSRVRKDDYDYLRDIDQEDNAFTDDYMLQQLAGSYDQEHYNVNAEVRRYQSLLDPRYGGRVPFAMMPKISGSWYNTYGSMLLRVDAEAVRFNQDQMNWSKNFTSERTHLEPSLKYHIFDSNGARLDAGGRVFLTHYNQDDDKALPASYKSYLGYDRLDRSKTRSLFELELDGKTTFERKVLDMSHTQTLEPEIKYQYVPYRNQNDIALYDTTDRVDDFYSLFSYKKYAGLDRIADMNMMTAGITSRLLDVHDREIMRIGVAQAYNFVPSRVTLRAGDKTKTYPRSPIAAIFDANPTETLNVHAQVTYNTEDSEFKAYNASFRYLDDDGLMAGLSYRFLKDGNTKIANSRDYVDLRQFGVEFVIPLNENWKLTGASYRDLEQDYNIDSKLALKYDTCGYSISLVYEDYMKMDWNKMDHDNDRIIGIQFELKGFYELAVRGIDNPNSTSTHYIPSMDPTNLNR